MSYLSITKKGLDVAILVKRQYGDESGVQITDEDIIRWINYSQDEIFRRNEPVKAKTSTPLILGQKEYTFPLEVLKVQAIHVNGIPVKQLSFQDYQQRILDEGGAADTSEQPEYWYEFGGTFTFWPSPSTNGIIDLFYIKAPTPITMLNDSLSVPDTYFNRLCESVLAQAYELDENWEAAQIKATQFGTNMEAQVTQDSVSSDTYPVITARDEDLW